MTDTVTQLLDWDSERLGVRVAKIISDQLDNHNLESCLNQLQKQGVKLVYWAIPSNQTTAITAAQNHHGILVDEKLTYLIDLSSIKPSNLNIKFVEEYTLSYPNNELLKLAFDSGNYSRFRQDPNLTEMQFQAIYREWITNSVNKTIADKILIIKQKEKIIAMITLGEKNHRGDIGLLAVSEQARGQQLGTQLIHAAQHYFIEKGFSESQVVTQKANIPACRLYEKCGYHIEKLEYFFHFWI